MDMNLLFKTLAEDNYGILRSQSDDVALSYPDCGNDICFDLEDNSFWFKHRNNIISTVFSVFPPPQGPIVDVGGGNGFVTQRLLKDGLPAILVEPGPTGAWNAKIKRKLPWVVCSSLEQSGLPEKSVAAVGCFDVLEHIKNDRQFLKNVARILIPGGMLYLAVPANQWLWSYTDVSSGHYRRYNRQSLEKTVGDLFKPVYFTHFFGLLTVPLFLLKTLPSLMGVIKNQGLPTHKTEHGVGNKCLSETMQKLLKKEISMVLKKRSSAWGTSCLIVAKKEQGRSGTL